LTKRFDDYSFAASSFLKTSMAASLKYEKSKQKSQSPGQENKCIISNHGCLLKSLKALRTL
jgi:hypothetical protein